MSSLFKLYSVSSQQCVQLCYCCVPMQIMLGLTTHEPHFSLLREEVRFTGKNSQKRSTAPEETTFHLLHLSLMREYLEFEFGELRVWTSFNWKYLEFEFGELRIWTSFNWNLCLIDNSLE